MYIIFSLAYSGGTRRAKYFFSYIILLPNNFISNAYQQKNVFLGIMKPMFVLE